MPNILDEFDGDVFIPGNLEVGGSINDADVAEILAAAQVTSSVAEVLQSTIADMFSDGKLTPVEKIAVSSWWDAIKAEYTNVTTRAGTWAIDATFTEYSDFTTAYSTLNTYITTILSDLRSTTTVTQATMRGYRADYNEKKEALLDLIESMGYLVAPSDAYLVGYLPLDEIEGTRVVETAKGHDGTLTAGGAWEDGHVGNAYHFDGAAGYIEIADHADFDFGSGDFTVMGWVYLDNATGADEYLVSKRTGTANGFDIRISNGDSDKIAFVCDPGTAVEILSNDALSSGSYVFVACVRDSGTMYMYINGILQTATDDGTGDIDNAIALQLGAKAGASFFDGKLDEVRIYNIACTAANIMYMFRNPGGFPHGLVTRNDVAVGEVNAKHLLFGGYKSLITNDELWDEDDGELFTLGFDLISDGGRSPVEKLVHKEPAILRTSDEVEYNNPRARQWDGLADDPYTDTIGVWNAGTNLVPYPEDVTEWDDNGNCTPSVLEETFDGVPWQRVTIDGAGDAHMEEYIEFGTDPISVRIIMRKGAAQAGKSIIQIIDRTVPAGGGVGYIQCAVIFGNETTTWIDSGTGVVVTAVDVNWILANTIVLISFVCAGFSTANAETYIAYWPDSYEYAGRYADFCMIQVEDNNYPTPYAFDTRPAGTLEYKKNLTDEGAIECWVRPRFAYDDADNHTVWAFYKSSSEYLRLQWRAANDEFQLLYRDGGTVRTLEQGVNWTNTTLWGAHWIKACWDFSNSTGKLIVDGVTKDSSWSGTCDTYDGDIWKFFIGSLDGTNDIFDGEITDLVYYKTEDDAVTHYTNDKPWTGQYDVPNYDQSVIITRKALKLTRAELSVIDKKNRSIDVGTQGILARDRVGNVIHDISNGAILSDMLYGGHIYFRKWTSLIDNLTETWEDAQVFITDSESATQTLDISSLLPEGLDNPSGLLLGVDSRVYMELGKATEYTLAHCRFVYANEYGGTPQQDRWGGGVYLWGGFTTSRTASARVYTQAIIPVVYDSGTPYIVWAHRRSFGSLVASTFEYSAGTQLWLQGFVV